ncbi:MULTISPECIES: helix-turn-helix transcriptional regulator [unclassified Bacillus cereus group]|uniref:helix-turn-helix transcriptional regulator n=1 Tax=unclassified Bacillus cereus group TaxID=2750818 RepID=UPI001F564CFB|nr:MULTISPECIES: helix-turn-helix transcriptional regulator [unclassified Bacillus cereus group]
MNIGSIIYFHRIKNNLTQQQLADGVCSISHLSKIENNSKEVNIETLLLLCEKLKIDLIEEKAEIKLIYEKLNELLNAIVYDNKLKVDELYEWIKENSHRIVCSQYVYFSKIILFRYYVFKEDIKSATLIKDNITRQQKKFSQYENSLFQYSSSLYYLLQRKPGMCIKILNRIENEIDILPTDYYYYLSQAYNLLNQSTLSMYYAQKANQIFIDTINYMKSLDAKLLIAINLAKVKAFKQAYEYLEDVLNTSESLGNRHLLKKTFYNMSVLMYQQKRYEEAVDYFKKGLRYKKRLEVVYIQYLPIITECYIQLNKPKKAKNIINKMIKLAEEENVTSDLILFNIYLYELEKNEKGLIKYLESYAIKILKDQNQYELFMKYSRRLGRLYLRENDYKKAFQYLITENFSDNNQICTQ